MKSNWSNSAALALMTAAVLLLAILRRLDLLLIAAPLSAVFSLRLARPGQAATPRNSSITER